MLTGKMEEDHYVRVSLEDLFARDMCWNDRDICHRDISLTSGHFYLMNVEPRIKYRGRETNDGNL